ncbi:hypothetical protein E4T56_gene541 [Termitomyces sp. T112]|nr:hypothetical protein E4T56_gene541 [Termitomyces sp. T112]
METSSLHPPHGGPTFIDHPMLPPHSTPDPRPDTFPLHPPSNCMATHSMSHSCSSNMECTLRCPIGTPVLALQNCNASCSEHKEHTVKADQNLAKKDAGCSLEPLPDTTPGSGDIMPTQLPLQTAPGSPLPEESVMLLELKLGLEDCPANTDTDPAKTLPRERRPDELATAVDNSDWTKSATLEYSQRGITFMTMVHCLNPTMISTPLRVLRGG